MLLMHCIADGVDCEFCIRIVVVVVMMIMVLVVVMVVIVTVMVIDYRNLGAR